MSKKGEEEKKHHEYLSEKAKNLLKSNEEILKFEENETKKMKQKLDKFDGKNIKPMNSNQAGRALDIAFTTRDFGYYDDDFDRWGRRQFIIDSSGQDLREFCKSKGNSNEHCICALERPFDYFTCKEFFSNRK